MNEDIQRTQVRISHKNSQHGLATFTTTQSIPRENETLLINGTTYRVDGVFWDMMRNRDGYHQQYVFIDVLPVEA